MKKYPDLFILILLVLVLANGLFWASSIPFNSTPDEYDHFRLVNFIAKHNRVPVLGQDQDFYYASIESKLPINANMVAYHKAHPELFGRIFLYELKPPYMLWPFGPYVFFALFLKLAAFFPSLPSFYFARFLSVLCAGATVFLLYDLAKRKFPDEPYLAKTAAVFAGFLPQFTFLSASINPDIVTAFVTTLIFWVVFVRLGEDLSLGSVVLFGTVLGLTVLSKISGYSAGIAAFAAFVLLLWKRKDDFSRRRVSCAVCRVPFFMCHVPCEIRRISRISPMKSFYYFMGSCVVCLATCVWFFLHNRIVYGDWFGYATYSQRLAEVLAQTPKFIRQHDIFFFLNIMPFDPRAIPYLIKFCFRTFWGTFGWATVSLPGLYYDAAYILSGLSLLGLFKGLYQKRKRQEIKTLGFFLATLTLQLIAVVCYVLMIKYQPQGRYFLAVIAPVAVIFSYGLLSLAEKYRRAVFFALTVFLVGMNLYSVLYCRIVHYFRPLL